LTAGPLQHDGGVNFGTIGGSTDNWRGLGDDRGLGRAELLILGGRTAIVPTEAGEETWQQEPEVDEKQSHGHRDDAEDDQDIVRNVQASEAEQQRR
jgi:hypothetical protein